MKIPFKKSIFVIICLTICLTSALSSAKVLAFNQNQDQKQNATPLPIIMYHSVLKKNLGKYVVSPQQFEKDLIYIKQNGYTTILVKDLVDFKEGGKPLPKKPIMLTFDDGNLSNYLNAFPLLKKYKMKAVMSIVGGYADSNYDDGGNLKKNQRAYINYQQLKEMNDSGLVEVQNHTYNMHRLGQRRGLAAKRGESDRQYQKALTEDLLKMSKALEAKAGIKCTAVAFPFGAYSKSTVKIVKQLGFKAAFTCSEGINYVTPQTDLFTLKRFNRPYGETSEKFFKKIIN